MYQFISPFSQNLSTLVMSSTRFIISFYPVVGNLNTSNNFIAFSLTCVPQYIYPLYSNIYLIIVNKSFASISSFLASLFMTFLKSLPLYLLILTKIVFFKGIIAIDNEFHFKTCLMKNN